MTMVNAVPSADGEKIRPNRAPANAGRRTLHKAHSSPCSALVAGAVALLATWGLPATASAEATPLAVPAPTASDVPAPSSPASAATGSDNSAATSPTATTTPATAAVPPPTASSAAAPPAPPASSAAASPKVSTVPADPPSAPRRSFWNIRLGYGVVRGDGFASGPAFGTGYRYEDGSWALDVTLFNFILGYDDGVFNDPNGPWAQVGAIRYLRGQSNSSPYVGAGLGWGTSSVHANGTTYRNSGAEVGLFLGYEWNRRAAIHPFLQLDANVPLYRAHGYRYDPNDTQGPSRESLYTPTLCLSLGI